MNIARRALVGWGAAGLMLATLAAISLSGEWPTDAPLERAESHGILVLPAAAVARIEIAQGDRRGEFVRTPSGEWLMDNAHVDAAIAGHLDSALRFLNLSAPDRVLHPGEYSDHRMADYGLDPPRSRVTVVLHDAKTAKVEFGDLTPTQISQYALVEGQTELYLLSRFVGAEWQLALDMAARASGSSARDADGRASSLLSPVSIERVWAVELVEGGRLVRFERDPAGNWFHHVGEHIHAPGGFVHRADPALAPLIAAELAGFDQTPVEAVVAHKPDDDTLSEFGLAHPSNIVLLYSRDSSRPVARIEIGGTAKDGRSLYARAQGSDTVVT
ncbi:MAG TPA: DUF4340 domain-containing protein, partial [Rhodopila sp.]